MLIGADNGPMTTMDEDLEFLGMGGDASPLAEDRRRPAHGRLHEGEMPPALKKAMDAKKGSSSDDDDDDDDDSGEKPNPFAKKEDRTEVPVREEGCDDDEDEEDDEDEDDAEESEDFDGEFITEDEDPEVFNEAMELLAQYFIDEGYDIASMDKAVGLVIEMPNYDERALAALDVIESFEDTVANLQEGDTQPSYDELVGVIEAYEAATGGAEGLTEVMATMGAKVGSKVWRGGSKVRITAKGARLGVKKAKKQHSMGLDKPGMSKFKLVQTKTGGFKKVKKSSGEKRAQRKLGKRGKAKRMRHAAQTRAKNAKNGPMESTNVSELVANLQALKNSVDESADWDTAAEELIEGFGSLHSVATDYFERIAKEVAESEDVAEDDARVAMGRHLEAISIDAAKRAAALREGEDQWSLEQFAEDLQALAADLDDAMEAMGGIE